MSCDKILTGAGVALGIGGAVADSKANKKALESAERQKAASQRLY